MAAVALGTPVALTVIRPDPPCRVRGAYVVGTSKALAFAAIFTFAASIGAA